MTKPEQIKTWILKPVDGFKGNIIIQIVVHLNVFKWTARKGERYCASWMSNLWCALISVCNIVCRTSLEHNKTDEFEINCILLCNDGGR